MLEKVSAFALGGTLWRCWCSFQRKTSGGNEVFSVWRGCGVWNWDLAVLLCTAEAPTRRAVTFSASPEKVTKKGRLLLERSKSFFMPGGRKCCNVVFTHPMTGAVYRPNAYAPPHAGAKPVRG
jgi:hypothetical protein